ncbi:MAG: PQQ-binding-like beta-propeller repeat protein [Armatimonadota bacterium]
MDYRSRWQQKRRERATRQRLIVIAAALVIAAAAVLAVRGIARPAASGYQLPGPTVAWLSATPDALLITTRGGELLKLTPELGEIEAGWARPFTHPAGFWGRAGVAGGNALIGCEDVRVRAVDLASGVQSWELRVDGSVPGVTAFEERVYFASAEPALYAATAGGTLIWRAPLQARVAAPPLVREETVVVGTLAGSIAAYERATGRIIWDVKPESAAPIHASPVMGPSSILVGSDAGLVHSISREGELLTSMEFEGLVRHPVAVRDAVVVVGDSSGLVRRINPSDMTEIWSARLPGGLAAEPIIAGDVVWCGAARKLIALDAATGHTVSRRVARAQTSDILAAHGRIYWATTDGRIGAVSTER